jgi:DNA-binding NarL/FixJ family response regulator
MLRLAVRALGDGGTFVDPRTAARVVEMAIRSTRPHGPHGLTAQEMRILRMLPRGLTNREIAAQLRVSTETVKSHIRSIFRKLQVSDRVDAARIAVREGMA